VLDTSANRIVAEFEVDDGPSSMAVTPDGRKLYVTRGPANRVSVVDASSYKPLAQVSVGVRPVSIMVSESNPPFER
jgi:YVTN family beta-propeller protein